MSKCELILSVVLLATVAGCNSSPSPAPAASPIVVTSLTPIADPQGRALAPLSVQLEEKSRGEHGAVLVARIQRRAAFQVPMLVGYQLPAGVVLVRGTPTFEIPAGTPVGNIERELELGYEKLPAADVRVFVRAQKSSFGVNATAVYRFGRPEPIAAPPIMGTDTILNGQNLGPSVKMK